MSRSRRIKSSSVSFLGMSGKRISMLKGGAKCVNCGFDCCSLSGTAAFRPPILLSECAYAEMHAMSSAADPAGDHRAALLRKIPSVDELLGLPELAELATSVSRDLVVAVARNVLERIRGNILLEPAGNALAPTVIAAQIASEVAGWLGPSLRGVINATGVILHTNLGRAPLAEAAIEHIRQTAGQYT